VMRAFPNMAVIVPADGVEAAKMVAAVAEYEGPVYLRMSRAELPVIYADDHQVEIGRGATLRDGNDVTVVATGVMVYRALQAADNLAAAGIRARVLALHTIKPLDRALLLRAAEETGALVTCEEHSIVGGLGAAVAELVSGERPVPVVRVGVADRYTESGPYNDLMDRYGLSLTDIEGAAKRAMTLRDEK
jgi:transketolase